MATVPLHEFVTVYRDEIIRRCRAKVAARSDPPPTDAAIEFGVPLFLEQLVVALRLGQSSSLEIGTGAARHGHELQRQGLTVSHVVHGYGDVCQSITELAIELDAPISTDDFRLLNGCLDTAIADAVTQYGRERQPSTPDTGREHQPPRVFEHELRELIQTAMMAFEVIKSGNVGVGGSTGAVLQKSLTAARDLVARSLAQVQLAHDVQTRS